jgi:hypothetical protein
MIHRGSATDMPYYRSRVTRSAFILTGTYLAWVFTWGPDAWRDTPSLHWLDRHLLPATVITVLFAVYVALNLIGRPRCMVAACGVGLYLYGWQLLALVFTLDIDKPSNQIALAAVALALTLHYACLRLVFIQIVGHSSAAEDDR